MSNIRSAAATILSLALGLTVLGGPVAAGGPTTRYVDDDGTAGRAESAAAACEAVDQGGGPGGDPSATRSDRHS